MRLVRLGSALLIIGLFAPQTGNRLASAQTPSAAKAADSGAASSAYGKPQGTLQQVMRGILLPSSNVFFFVQANDPATVKPSEEPSSATDPLAGVNGGWTAVENSAIAMAEAANLISMPGRMCANGRPVPVNNADWIKFVQGLREAGMAAYQAAQSKNQDKVVEVADQVSTACSNCHNVYRPKCTN